MIDQSLIDHLQAVCTLSPDKLLEELDGLSSKQRERAMLSLGYVQRRGRITSELYEKGVRHLVEAGCDINGGEEAYNDQPTPVRQAVAMGLDDLLAYLLEKGALPSLGFDGVDDEGDPLHVAVGKGNLKATQLLLQAGADINAPGPDEAPPIEFAVAGNNHAMIRYLVEKGARLNYPKLSGVSALHAAAYWDHCTPDTFALLLELGADTQLKDRQGNDMQKFLQNPGSDDNPLVRLEKLRVLTNHLANQLEDATPAVNGSARVLRM